MTTISLLREENHQNRFSFEQSLSNHYYNSDFDYLNAPIQQFPAIQSSLEEKLFNSASQCKILFSQLAVHLNKDWRQGIFRQLDNLLDIESWEEEDLPVNPESFRTLLRFLILSKTKKRPGFGASYDGHIIANWDANKNRLTVECKPKDYVHWIVSYQADEETEFASGSCKIERLQDVLVPYNPVQWFINDEKA